MPFPSLIGEIDFTGLPTAEYFDTLSNDSGIVSYWRMSNTGATLTDVVGSNNGTLVGSPGTIAGFLPNDSDTATVFDGSTDSAYVASNPDLTPTMLTLKGLVKVSSYPAGTRDLFGKRGSYVMQMLSSGKVQFSVKNDTTITTVTSGTALATGGTFHLDGTYSGSTVSLYVNGVLDQASGHTVGIASTPNLFRFASSQATVSPAFQSAQTVSGSGTAVTVTAPASIAAGDFLTAQVATSTTGTVSSITNEWNLLNQVNLGSGAITRVYGRVAGTAEPATYSWVFASSGNYAAGVARFTGVDPQTPVSCSFGTIDAPTSISTGSHLPNNENNKILGFFAVHGASVTFTEDFGTERYEVSANRSIAMTSGTQATPAALNITATSSGGAQGTAQFVELNGLGLTRTAVTLDEVSFLNRAIDSDEVVKQFQSRLAGLGSWTAVSSDILDKTVDFSGGRNYELNRIEAATASLTLRNTHRRYDPANTSSIYYPNVKINRKLRLRATLSAVSYPLFEGFIDNWPSKWEVPNYDEVDISITDGFKSLNLAGVAGILDSALSGAQIDTVLNKALWPVDTRAIDTGLFAMAADTTGGTVSALGVTQDIADSELGVFFIDHTVDRSPATFHDRSHRWSDTRSVNVQATFADDGTGIAYRPSLRPSLDDSALVNEWNVSTADGTTRSAADPVSRSENFPVTQDRATRLDTPTDAQTQATALLQQTARPTQRFDGLTVRLTRATVLATWQTILGLAISDRVTVKRNPVPAAGGSTITRDCFIEAIQWQITNDYWDATYQLSPIATATYEDTVLLDEPVSFWRMDTAT